MDRKRLEIVSLVERRRKWPAEEKARIMEEALAPGATVASVADRHRISRSQVYTWLKKARTGKLPGIAVAPRSCAPFIPVRIEETIAAPAPAKPVSASPARRRASTIEIALGNGRTVKVDEGINPAVLGRIVGALDKRAS